MKSVKVYALLTTFAAAVLAAAAVWLGGLNQDEGWYLYAAQLVGEGEVPYRDFFFTQGPVMPYVYSAFAWVWKEWGLLGARVLTVLFGAAATLFAAALAHRLAPDGAKARAATAVALLLGCNLYHVYYTAIPKTYALASLFVAVGFYLLSFRRAWPALAAGLALAFAAGTRTSLGALLCVAGLWLLCRREWRLLAAFCAGGFFGLCLVYAPFALDARSLDGLLAAQRYHTARGGFDPVWAVGSLSRLVRWYLPVFVVLGLGVGKCRALSTKHQALGTKHQALGTNILLLGFLAVFVVQMLAPFPYEDYQVPVMGLLAVCAAVTFANISTPPSTSASSLHLLLVLGLCFANSFGSPLLEKWMTNGQDRFWSLKKEKCELAQLRDVARRIKALDPDGKPLLTQDLYLAIETGRKVPKGLEMGPFAMLTDAEWVKLLAETAPAVCRVAALSGYSFAIDPPACTERPVERQMAYWELLKRNYRLADREEAFGQNATPLIILERK